MKKKNNAKMMKNVIRIIALAMVLLTLALIPIMMFTGCSNMALVDTTWSFEEAIIFLPDGEKIEGKVTSWTDYDGSDMIQVTIGGKTYLTHSSNVIMISK